MPSAAYHRVMLHLGNLESCACNFLRAQTPVGAGNMLMVYFVVKRFQICFKYMFGVVQILWLCLIAEHFSFRRGLSMNQLCI